VLVCSRCSTTYPDSVPRWRCDCGSPLRLVPSGIFRPGDLSSRSPTLWRYREALGFDGTPVTLGEGMTPLIPARVAERDVLLKLDFVAPTGSYKDRGTTVMISKLKEWGITSVVEDSSGNAGASVAAYAAAAGMAANIFIPENTSAGKAVQIAMYGAQLVRVPGSREDTTRAAEAAAQAPGSFYGSHNWNPYFIAGLKTLGFEIAEQLQWQAPDWIVTPLGGGSLLLGLYYAFQEMIGAGIVDRMPQLAAVQAENCAPVYHAWKAELDEVPAIVKGPTIAEGITIAKPVKGRDILQAIRGSDGVVVPVSDDAIWSAMDELGRAGAYTEPTGAVSAAALPVLMQSGVIAADQRVVLVLTGSGLKATDRVTEHYAKLYGAKPRH
jgi:threonine synthase